MRYVRELMSPVEHAVFAAQSLEEVAHLVRGPDPAVVVLSSAHHPVGLLTEDNLAAATSHATGDDLLHESAAEPVADDTGVERSVPAPGAAADGTVPILYLTPGRP